MATLVRLLLLLFIFSDSFSHIHSLGVGINYGQLADNLPSPSRVASLLQSLNITRVKLNDADPIILSAFANTQVEFIIGLGNGYLHQMTNPAQAQAWIQQHVQPYISTTKIKCITVGNEVLTSTDTELISNLVPAMKSISGALTNLGLNKQIFVTTSHSLGILNNSFPPSAVGFKPSLVEHFQDILNFHEQTQSPFLINAYPFSTYKANAGDISLKYALFEPNPGWFDPITSLLYDNLLYTQIDSVYSAIKALGHRDIEVIVSETGWPSKGDLNTEVAATAENAGTYIGNLLNRMRENQGTPARPNVPVQVFVSSLFNENLKSGPTSENNFGLYHADGTPAYRLGIQGAGYLPRMKYSDSEKNISRCATLPKWPFLSLLFGLLLCCL